MQRPNPEATTLSDVLMTAELSRRVSRAPNLQAENQAMRVLIHQMAQNSEILMQTLVDKALELCGAGTAGLSLLETTPEQEEIFRWTALAGTLAHQVGGCTPRDFSPCGVCLDQGSPVLFSHPERYFTYFQEANTPIVEGLVLPLVADRHIFGTIWIVSHDTDRQIDSEDVRIMTSLADLTATALLLQQRQTRELLAANAALQAEVAERQQAEARAQALISNLPGGAVFVVDRDLRYVLAEGEALATAGLKPEDLVGRTIFEALPPDLAASYEPLYHQALAGEPFEYEHQAHDRTYISRGTPLRAEDGEIYAVLVVSYDITDRKQVEAALRESEAFRRLAVESGRMGTWRWDCQNRQCWGDAEFLSLWGISSSDAKIPVSVFTNRTSPEGAAALETVMTKNIAPGEEFDGQLEIVAGPNAGHWIRWRGRAEHETPWIINGVSFDITEQRQAEAALCESEARLQSIANLVPDLLWDSEPDGSTNWYNQRWMEYTGQTFEQAIGWGWVDAIHPDDREGEARHYREAVEQGVRLQQEHRIRRYDGEYRWFIVKASPLKDENGKVLKMYGAATDIHEARLSLAALQESEAKYRSLFNSIDEGFCLFEMMYDETGKAVDYRFLEVNSVFERQTGLKSVVGKLGSEVVPNTESYWLEAYDEVIKTGDPQQIENYNQATDRWYSAYASQVGDVDSRQICAVFNDITDRKRHEQRQACLLQLSDALRSLSDAVEIHAAVTRIAMNFFGADRCYYCEIIDSNAIIRRDAFRENLTSVAGVYPLSDFPIFKAVIDAGHPLIVEDAHTTDVLDEALRQLCCEFQVISFIGVPVIKEGKPAGIFCITQSTPRNWTAFETELAQETAEQVWAAVERAKAEAALRKSEEQFRAFVTASSDMVYKMSADWHEMRNFGGKNILVNTANPNQTWIDTYIPPTEQPRVWATIQEAIQTKSTFELEHQGIRQDGSIGWFFSCVVPILDEQENIIEWFGASSDITIRKQAEVNEIQLIREQAAREKEYQRAESLAELDRTKTLFFSNISHEFRTPLMLSLAPLQEVLKRVEEWEQGREGEGEQTDHPLPHQPIVPSTLKQNLQLVHRNHLRLLKLVNTLLDFSQIEAGRMTAVYEPTDLATFTKELTSVFRSAIDRAGLQLIVDCPPLPEPVYVDREMWEKIVLNLLSNALKFTFEGEIRVRLSLGTGEMESKGDGEMGRCTSTPQVMLEICDTGVGIAPEHLPHLFERFYQVRGTQSRTYEGSGIGLALVHELVRFHGGTIDVSSTVGEGTCFTIALPFGTDHLPSDRLPDQTDLHPIRTLASTTISPNAYLQEAERWLSSNDFGLPILDFGLESSDTASPDRDFDQLINPPKSKIQNPKSKILLVDDNADMREYLTRILGEYVHVKAIADGKTALKVAQEEVPDLILSDVMMPGLDGFDLLRSLRADPRTKEIPIILLSARAGEEAIVEGLEAGADDYWIKPFSAQELISRVMAHLEMAQLRGAALQQERTMNRHKDEFISVISHELNTPLVSILGWTRLLRSSPLNLTMLNKALDMIERNATLQGHLVQDLLDLSRMTAGKLRLNLQPIALKPVIETAIATVIQTASAKDIHLTWQNNDLSPMIMGDSHRLSQVLINFLSNAIKFTPESGHIQIELSVIHNGCSDNPSYAEIRVMDTGIGIDADFLPHVFDRFRQAEGTHATKGLGLGLAIARHIVELHNGSIRAESPGKGQGTTLIVELPLIQ